MSRRDIYHNTVIVALTTDGWTITDDPFTLFNLYQDILSEIEPERLLYLAIPERTYKGIFSHPLGQLIQKRQQLSLVVFDENQERIIKWIP